MPAGISSLYLGGGGATGRPGYYTPPPKSNLYGSAVEQNAEDYDAIMGGYRNLLNTPYTPQSYNYQQTPESRGAISNLSNLAATGGYSPEDIANIRARGVSPIRSIYAGANRDIDRQRALQGGYSPGYGALKSKMARELSESIGNQVTNVNADIAQRVAGNKIAVAPTYASAAGQESALRNQYGRENVTTSNEAQLQNAQRKAGALSGMQSLYGTTPAMTALFGQQALQEQQQGNQRRNQNLNFVNSAMSRFS